MAQIPARAEGGKPARGKFAQAVGQAVEQRRHQRVAVHARQPRHAGRAATQLRFHLVRHQQVQADADHAPGAAARGGLGFDQDASQFVAILEDIVRPLQLYLLAQRAKRVGQRHAHRQRQAKQRLWPAVEAPGQRKRQRAFGRRQPAAPGAPAAGALMFGYQQQRGGKRAGAREQIGIGRPGLRDDFNGDACARQGGNGGGVHGCFRRGLVGARANRRSNRALGIRRSSLATMPICHGSTR